MSIQKLLRDALEDPDRETLDKLTRELIRKGFPEEGFRWAICSWSRGKPWYEHVKSETPEIFKFKGTRMVTLEVLIEEGWEPFSTVGVGRLTEDVNLIYYFRKKV